MNRTMTMRSKTTTPATEAPIMIPTKANKRAEKLLTTKKMGHQRHA